LNYAQGVLTLHLGDPVLPKVTWLQQLHDSRNSEKLKPGQQRTRQRQQKRLRQPPAPQLQPAGGGRRRQRNQAAGGSPPAAPRVGVDRSRLKRVAPSKSLNDYKL
jgi:hypothetical protein